MARRNVRWYTLYRRPQGSRRWQPCYPTMVGPLDWARRVFQSALIFGTVAEPRSRYEYSLRPVAR